MSGGGAEDAACALAKTEHSRMGIAQPKARRAKVREGRESKRDLLKKCGSCEGADRERIVQKEPD
jgi:hypothetical protein